MSVAGSLPGGSAAIQTNPLPSTTVPFPDEISPAAANCGGSSSTPPTVPVSEEEASKKPKKRSLFGFGKKTTDESKKSPPANTSSTVTSGAGGNTPPRQATSSPVQLEQSHHQSRSATKTPVSPGRPLSSSPGRGGLASSPRLSPRLGSPAGSQIFERDVQDAAALPNSPAIPSHIATENYIPPVLDASSEAITDERIDPDSVEIITHTSHQPAGLAVTGAGAGALLSSSSLGSFDHNLAASWAAELAGLEHDRSPSAAAAAHHHHHHYHSHPADAAGTGATSLDSSSPDIRRLSFISFADVVLSEQGHTSPPAATAGTSTPRDSIHVAGLTALASTMGSNRSPSPIRSPVSSSPPTSNPGSIRGLDASPPRKYSAGGASGGLALSPINPPIGDGELKIETMSQALRRTGSSDLGGLRSMPISPVDGPSSR